MALVGLISERIHSASVSFVGVGIIVLSFACYTVALYALRQHRTTLGVQLSNQLVHNERRAMKMVLVIITCFVVTLLPMLVEKLLYSVGVIGITPKFHMFAVTLYISNSALNPIIYASRIPAIRKYGVQLLCCRKERHGEGRESRESTTTMHFGQLAKSQENVLNIMNISSKLNNNKHHETTPMLP